VVDAAMNDLIRPALYSAYHHVLPVLQGEDGKDTELFDVVGTKSNFSPLFTTIPCYFFSFN
jgi:diaminopimelate decarboxylase